jgi:CRP-like cAMP-binding protein
MAGTDELVDTLAGFSLFSDLTRPQLERVVHTLDEEMFSQGQRILRQGFSGSGFYLIIEGEATVVIDGQDRARLAKGDFFGEVSALLGELPTADVVAVTPLRCLVLAGPQIQEFLVGNPAVTFRMLQAEARRLRTTLAWRS